MRRWLELALVCAGVFALSFALPASAEPLERRDVPPPLEPWIDWVLRGSEDAACALRHGAAGERLCDYPARVELELGANAGSFRAELYVARAGWLRVPGGAALWPLDVKLDSKSAGVVERGGAPSLWLEPGRHVATGAFAYAALPEAIAIPPDTALLQVRVNGQTLARPRREPDGRVWLRTEVQTGTRESRLEVTVNRLVQDGVPLELETRLELRVSGDAREATLGPVLPAGLVPLSLDGDLPARVEPDGTLRVQLRPGVFQLSLRARSTAPVESLAPPRAVGAWGEPEIWVYSADPSARIADVEGVPAVDPQQTSLPPEWRQLPAYLVERDATLRLVERRRGDADPAPDALTLERTLWLDFAGGGYTIHDRIGGRLSKSWRLELPEPMALGRVAVDGVDQLIGRVQADAPPGVEVRQADVNVEADSRLEGATRALPAVGWGHDFTQVSAELRLPPGWRLFHATGVDEANTTWIRSWTLLDLFFVLVIALAIARLRSREWGALALVALVLIWPEADAPQISWLVLLGAHALVVALPEGRLRALLRGLRLAALVLALGVSVPFAVQQLRLAVYPGLELSGVSYGEADASLRPGGAMMDVTTPMRADMPEPAAEGIEEYESAKSSVLPRSMPAPSKRRYSGPEPGALVTTGPGLPSWSWRRVSLGWSGPVQRDQQLGLWLVAPWANALLGWLRVALLVLLLVAAGDFDDRAGAWLRRRRGVAAAALALLAFTATPLGDARAQEFPPEKLLEELRARLTEEPSCAPGCASSPRLLLEVEPDVLRARIEIHAAARTAVPLPGGASDWSPEQVTVDGAPATALARDRDGRVWLALEPGLHQVQLVGRLPEHETVELPLPLRPRRVEARVSGWTLHGVHDDGTPDASLQLARAARAAGAAAAPLEAGELPPFLRIERTLSLGVTWQVETRVLRLSPPGKALFLELPLLPGEAVTSPNVRSANGRAQVSLAPDARAVGWSSSLAETDSLALAASSATLWTEVWRLDASPIWHVDATGIPPVHVSPSGELRVREWRPWPKEEVALAITRPAAVSGPTLTLDRAVLRASPGLRATESELELVLRASRGSQHEITLPEGAELVSVALDGELQPIRALERRVALPVRPGRHEAKLTWRTPDGVGAVYRTSQVGVGAPAVNVELELALPANRWILLLGGPRLGPAVLFWSVLAVALIAALALGRVRLTPLGTTSWLLLFVGLSQVPLWLAFAIAGWLLVMGVRRERALEGNFAFDAFQVLLAAWTLFALVGLLWAVQQGLLGQPEMQIRGNGSTRELLRWYQDRSPAELPRALALSLPLWSYRVAMLAWALWLAFALLGWLRFVWECWSAGGTWKSPLFTPRRAAPRA